jgi:hypothetical protein
VITFAVDDWLLEQLLIFDAGSEDLEDDGDAGQDGPVFLMRLGAPITQRPTK